MLTIDYDLRWRSAWWLLSLDDAKPFFDELWIPFDAARLSNGLKSILRQWEHDHDFYHSNSSIISYECFRWFEGTFGTDQLERLIRWTDSVYKGQGGSNRTAEWVWSQIPGTIRRNQTLIGQLDPRIVDFLTRVELQERKIYSTVKDRLELQWNTPTSDWDSVAQAMEGEGREAHQDSITLIVRQNAFAFAWEKEASALGSLELNQLYELAKRLHAEYSVEVQSVVYPGSWRFFLLPFLQNAPAAWR